MIYKRVSLLLLVVYVCSVLASREGLALSTQQREEATYRFNLGLDYAQKSLWGAAMIEFKNALAIDPSFVEAYNNLGAVYFYKKRYSEAVSSYRKALKLVPRLAEVHFNLALAYSKMKKPDIAGEHFLEAGLLFLQRGDQRRVGMCLRALRRLGDTERARVLEEKKKSKKAARGKEGVSALQGGG